VVGGRRSEIASEQSFFLIQPHVASSEHSHGFASHVSIAQHYRAKKRRLAIVSRPVEGFRPCSRFREEPPLRTSAFLVRAGLLLLLKRDIFTVKAADRTSGQPWYAPRSGEAALGTGSQDSAADERHFGMNFRHWRRIAATVRFCLCASDLRRRRRRSLGTESVILCT